MDPYLSTTSKKKFKLNEENIPVSFNFEQRGESNFMVEEYMLLANLLVGRTLVDNVKELSLLRKHENPTEKKI